MALRKSVRFLKDENFSEKTALQQFITTYSKRIQQKYSSHLTSETEKSVLNIHPEKPRYKEEKKLVDARIIMRDNFDVLLKKHPELLIFGEDAGFIGDVNQGLEGLARKIWRIKSCRYRN